MYQFSYTMIYWIYIWYLDLLISPQLFCAEKNKSQVQDWGTSGRHSCQPYRQEANVLLQEINTLKRLKHPRRFGGRFRRRFRKLGEKKIFHRTVVKQILDGVCFVLDFFAAAKMTLK